MGSSLLAENPSMSMRAIAKELGVSRGSLGRILKDDEETCKAETSETDSKIKIETTAEPEVIVKVKSEDTNEEEGDSENETEAVDYNYPKCQICNLEFVDEGALVVHNFNNH